MEGARSKTPWSTKNIERFKSMRARIDEHNENLFQKHRLQANESFSEHLNEPEKEEMPRMLEKDPDGFYRLDMKDPRYQPSIDRDEIRYKTLGYREQEIPGERYITMNEFFEPRPGWNAKAKRRLERGLRAALIGSAGSGKTTLLGRFAREATKGNIPQMKKDDFLVHQVNCRELDPKKEISVPEFLFKIMLCKQLPSKEDMEIGWRWIQENAKKTALIIDSLDTMRFSLESVKRVIGPDDKATPDVILHNLLTGELFREGFVLTSSREYKIKGYEGALRPDKVISLAGLTKMSVRNLTKGFLGEEEGERVLGKLEQYPGLKELCETPVFLIFTIIGLKQKGDASAFVPKSMTGVLVNLVNCLSRSKHARTRERFSEKEFMAALNKMKDLAYNGMLDDRILYNEEDLKNAKLTVEEISDVAMVIPGRIEKSQQILETGAVSFFIHQTIGELFCALKICEMELQEFRQFVSKHLHRPKYSVIRLLICGVLLDDEVFKEASKLMLKEKNDFEEKRKILRESLKNYFHEFVHDINKRSMLELFHAICESGDGTGIVPPRIDEIAMSGAPLMASDTFAFGASIYHSSHLNGLHLNTCSLSSESVQALSVSLQYSNLKVTGMDVSGNSNMGVNGIFEVGCLVRNHQVYKLKMQDCGLKSEDVHSLDKGLGDSKVTEMDVSGNSNMGAKGFFAVGCLLRNHGVDKLKMKDCGLKSEEVARFDEGLGDGKVKEIDMRWQHHQLPIIAICNLLPKIAEYLYLEGKGLSEKDQSLLQRKLNGLYPVSLKVVICDRWSGQPEKTLRSEKIANQGSQLSQPQISFIQEEDTEAKNQKGTEKPDFRSKKQQKESLIEQSGGTICLGNVSLIVHKNSLIDSLNITLSILTDNHNLGLPEDQIPISYLIEIQFEANFPVPSTLKAPICFKKCDSSMVIKVYECSWKGGVKIWSEFRTHVEVRDGFVEFEISRAAALVVTTCSWRTDRVNFHHALLSKGQSFQSVVCFNQSAEMLKQQVSLLKENGYNWIHQECFIMSAEKGTAAVVRLKSLKPNKYEFHPPSKNIEPEIFKKYTETYSYTFILRHRHGESKTVEIGYEVDGKDDVFAVEIATDFSATPPTSNLSYSTTVYQGVTAGNFLGRGASMASREYGGSRRVTNLARKKKFSSVQRRSSMQKKKKGSHSGAGFPTRGDTRPPASRRVRLKPEEQGATEVQRKKRKKGKKDDELADEHV